MSPECKSRVHAQTKTSWLTSNRVLFWYTLVTIFFRCPSNPSSLSDNSPWMCKPYFEIREKVSPHLTPYYDTYAAPYISTYVAPYVDTYVSPRIDQVRPYANLVQRKVYGPASRIVKNSYSNHAEHRIAHVKDYSDREWERSVKPHIDSLGQKIHAQYQLYLAPHVSRGAVSLRPYLLRAQASGVAVYHRGIVPTYDRLRPRLQGAYAQARAFAIHVAYPRVRWAVQNTTTFVTRRIWPTIRILYGQNIEPQLSKIRERLSSYRDSKKLEAVVDAIVE